MKNKVDLAVVVLNYNDAETTSAFVDSIKDYNVISHIIIVDNCSTDDSFNKLKCLANDKIDVICSQKNGGYGYGNNFGIRYAVNNYNSEFIAISNPDVIIDEDAIYGVLEIFEKYEDAGIAVPMMVDTNGNRNYKCVWKVPTFWQYLLFSFKFLHLFTKSMFYNNDYFNEEIVDVGCVAGSFLIIKEKAFRSAGTYDENIFLFCEETSLGIRMMKTNYKSYIRTNKEFVHAHSTSIKKSINSSIKRSTMIWDSREYVLTHYWKINHFLSFIIKILKEISVLELYIYYLGK